jgi:hypothetical protein
VDPFGCVTLGAHGCQTQKLGRQSVKKELELTQSAPFRPARLEAKAGKGCLDLSEK